MKLYSYFRSSASYRVRIALALKGIPYAYVPIHLVKGEQRGDAFAALSADRLVPVLEVDGVALSQSLAIIDYLEETHPEPRLLPSEPLARAQVRALAQTIACEIHPINNLRVLKYLSQELRVDDAAKTGWYRHWCRSGLEAVERQLAQLRAAHGPAALCFGDSPTLADCCLVPQIFNAQRFSVDLSGLPLTMAAYEAGMALPAVQQAQPSASGQAEG